MFVQNCEPYNRDTHSSETTRSCKKPQLQIVAASPGLMKTVCAKRCPVRFLLYLLQNSCVHYSFAKYTATLYINFREFSCQCCPLMNEDLSTNNGWENGTSRKQRQQAVVAASIMQPLLSFLPQFCRRRRLWALLFFWVALRSSSSLVISKTFFVQHANCDAGVPFFGNGDGTLNVPKFCNVN